ncbi:MAG: hypothetical protein ABSB57_03480, partial [Dehalococcoidia bacterium]
MARAPAAAPALSISLEVVVWLAVIGLAAALRLALLEHLPLTIDESFRSFAAWQTSQGDVPANWPGDMTSSLTAHLFSIFGSSDLLARLLPALAGSALIALLWPGARVIVCSRDLRDVAVSCWLNGFAVLWNKSWEHIARRLATHQR